MNNGPIIIVRVLRSVDCVALRLRIVWSVWTRSRSCATMFDLDTFHGIGLAVLSRHCPRLFVYQLLLRRVAGASRMVTKQ